MNYISDQEKIRVLTNDINDFLIHNDIDNMGIANALDIHFLNAPEKFQPKNVLEGAKSVIVFGKLLPKSVFKVKNHHTQVVHRLYHSLYEYLNIVASKLCVFLETKGHYAIPIPAYIPLRLRRNGEPWGIISLKHAGVAAGLGQIAKNGLLIHPKYGTMNRLAAVVTTAELSYNQVLEVNACNECNLCIINCPKKAISENGGNLKKLKCLFNVVKHGIFELHSTGDPKFIKNMELISNTMLLEYSVGCTKCLEVCPLNKTP